MHFSDGFRTVDHTFYAVPSQTKSEKEFPLTVRAGSTALKIYRDRKPSGDYFRLVYYLGGKRHRLNFNSLDAAKREAFAKVAQLSRGDVDAVQLNGRDRMTYGRALDARAAEVNPEREPAFVGSVRDLSVVRGLFHGARIGVET